MPISEIILDSSTATKKEKEKETYQETLTSSKTEKGVRGPTKGNPLSIILMGDMSFIFQVRFFFKNHKIKSPPQVREIGEAKHPEGGGEEAANLGASDLRLTSPGTCAISAGRTVMARDPRRWPLPKEPD